MDNSKFPEPRLAKGNIVPDFVVLNELKEAKEKELRRKQFIHDWQIAIVSLLGGAISGFVTSWIFWALSN